MSNQLAVRPQGVPEMDVFQLGKVFAQSGFFSDAKDEAKAIVKILAGRELGISEFTAMTSIHVIQGKPSVGAGLMAQKVKESAKYDYKVLQHSEQVCEIEFFQHGESIGVSKFTLEDARKAGTQNLQKYARNMLFARCISNGVKWYCPDVFTTTVYTPEEMGAAVDGEGNVVDAPATVQSTPVQDDTLILELRESYEQLLQEGAALGISRKELPDNASENTIQKYIAGLRGAIQRKQDAASTPVASTPADPQLATPIVDAAKARNIPNPEGAEVFDAADDDFDDAVETAAEVFEAEPVTEAEVVEPEPAPERERKSVKGFWAAANEKGLSSDDASREARMKAINEWLVKSKKDKVASINDLPAVLIMALTADIKTGDLTW